MWCAALVLGALSGPITSGSATQATQTNPGLRAALQREWDARRRALTPEAAREELLAALESEHWLDRNQALVACERSLAAGLDLPVALLEACAARLADGHPGVRARAAECIALLGREFVLDAARARRLAADPLPQVRLALAHALERVRCAVGPALLLALTRDADERVAESARRGLSSLPEDEAGTAAKLEYLRTLARERDAARLWQLAHWIENGSPDAAFLAAASVCFDKQDAESRGWRAVFVALAIGHTGRGDVRQLMAGWDGPIGGTAAGRRLLRFAARSGRRDLARAWLGAVEQGAEEDLNGALLTCLGARGVLDLVLEVESPWETWSFLLPGIGAQLDSWRAFEQRPDSGRWWEPGVERSLRLAAVAAFESTLSRRGDDAAARLLMPALDDPDADIARRVFRALARALGAVSADVRSVAGPLLASKWKNLDVDRRREFAAWIPRAHVPPAFRELLIAWGRDPAQRVLASELLGGYPGDGGVRVCLEAWLAEDLERCPHDRKPPRTLEFRVQGALRSLGLVAPAASSGALDAALVASIGRSVEIGKVAAAQLGRTYEGRRVLESRLGPRMDRRTRIEAGIALVSHSEELADTGPAAVLVSDYPHAASNLGVRILAACGRGVDPLSLELLERVGSSSDDRFELRLAAVDALAARGASRAVGELAAEDRDVELRRAAILALGTIDDAAARRLLVQHFDELEAASDATQPERSGMVRGERALLRAALLGVLGRAGFSDDAEVRERLEHAWLRAPLEQADARLAASFRGEERAAVGFDWSAELALGAELGAAGRIGTALGRHRNWWRLGGGLLSALAHFPRGSSGGLGAGDEGIAARDLTRAAVVALYHDAVPRARRDLGSARCRLLGGAWQARRWAAFRRLAEGLLQDRVSGVLPNSIWSRAFGIHSREDGVDPGAELRSSILVAAGWETLEAAGPRAVEAARGHLGHARAAAGISRSAAARCERLARSIARRTAGEAKR